MKKGNVSALIVFPPKAALCCLLLLTALLSFAVPSYGQGTGSIFGGATDFLPVDEALPFSFTNEADGVVLSWDITPGHYLYMGRIDVTSQTEGVAVGEPEFSYRGTDTEDEYFGQVTVFYDPVQAKLLLTLPPGTREAELEVTYQGCAKAGLCYPPQTRDVFYYAGSQGAASGGNTFAQPDSAQGSPPQDTSTATGLAGFLAKQSTLVIAGLFLLLGLGLTFTPCVLPMVPIISSLVSGKNTSTTGHALLLSTSYVLGMALTYAAAGVVTGLLGASFNLQAHLQSPWVLSVFAGLFVIFALSMFNLFEIQLPRFIREPLDDASQKLTGTRMFSVFGIGALSALVVSPCVSAPLAGSLLYISTTQDAVVGGVALFALGIGMGIPLILVAVGGRKWLPSVGPWMNVVKAFYGVMLLAVAIWLVERLVPAWLALTLWGLLVAITGVQLGAFDAAKAGWERTRKGFGLIMFVYGLALLTGAVTGASNPLRPLDPLMAAQSSRAGAAQAASAHAEFLRVESPADIREQLRSASRSNTPVVLDFYADWCISCKVMERYVFNDAQVTEALKPFILLQLDMTDNTPEQQAMLEELGLFGPPAILFYGTDGEELGSARVLGEMDRDQFLSHLGRFTPPGV